MDAARTEHERTLAFAEIALGQIKALSLLASPRNFEVWYNYATGYNQALNQIINKTIEQNGTLTEAELEQIYTNYIATNRIGERLDSVNARALDEIKQVLDMIGAAAGTATSYSESLAEASEKLAGAKDSEALRLVIERLVYVTKEMESNNKKLEARLSTSRQEIEQLQKNLELARSESLTDPLTTLSNRKYFDVALDQAITDAKLKKEPLTLLMTDIDHFKSFNDKFGHLTGDQVLRLVALSVKQNVKGQDVAARYGGEEFAVALPNTTLQSAITVADHIRRSVMTKELVKRSTGERLGRVTISIGAAVLNPQDTPQSLLERADRCLYAAKRNGRNRVVCEADPEVEAGGHAPIAAQVA
ncbi:MAG TPA: GGDEF domain-containing protein [Xanthobacteraceae bacterium]|nr:GGDEF domain-containing protein [Xanthobacteraceae bacterium]